MMHSESHKHAQIVVVIIRSIFSILCILLLVDLPIYFTDSAIIIQIILHNCYSIIILGSVVTHLKSHAQFIGQHR